VLIVRDLLALNLKIHGPQAGRGRVACHRVWPWPVLIFIRYVDLRSQQSRSVHHRIRAQLASIFR
jgi:hypothetical protein